MNADLAPSGKATGVLRQAPLTYRQISGQSLTAFALVALLNFITQVALRRELVPGEFGTLNTALGAIGLMAVPLLAVNLAFTLYLALPHASGATARLDSLRAAALTVTETFAWVWGGISLILIFLLLQLLELPRFSLQLFSLMSVLMALGSILTCAICQDGNRLRYWAGLLIAAAATRTVISAVLGAEEPWAESGLAAVVLAGFVTLSPALRTREVDMPQRVQAFRAIVDRDFLLYLGATFSVMLGLFLYSSADRIVGQSWFGTSTNSNIQLVDWPKFDAYQTAGLLGRSLLWGTQPLLWVFFERRAPLARTTKASLHYFWIYMATLLIAAFLLGLMGRTLSWIFCGDHFESTAIFVPSFAAVMVPLGFLQALGVFSLASRRYPECFVLGACSIGYTLLLYLAGRHAELMPAYMFGGALVSITIVLFVGVVRWGRKQP